jgi:hypothetical protein
MPVWEDQLAYTSDQVYRHSQPESAAFPLKEKADSAARAISGNFTLYFVYGHTKLKTPVLVRSLKLSNFGLR